MATDKAAPAAAKLKIAGAWTGVLEVQLESWTLPMLREELARRSGGSADCIKLICGGKILKDDGGSKPLQQLGLRNNSKVLASASSPHEGKALMQEEADQADRSSKLARIRAAADALALRHAGGSLPVEDFNLELENQSGQKVNFGSEDDKRALMMGLMLHENAKSLIKKQKFKDALDVLSIAEEAFSLCDSKIIEMIDNVPILQLDTVWCYFMLRDISCLSMAGARLAKSREGFQRSHGKDNSRFRLLQAGRPAELALYVRLELLEGVVAFYSGNQVESYKALSAAKSKFDQLQVQDEALSLLMSMGYKEKKAKRALRMNGQKIQIAVDFLIEEQAKKARRRQENILRQNEILEQKRYGLTINGRSVNIQYLNDLASMGFERYLAAEALRVNDNDTQKALDLLTDPEKNCALQQKIDSKKRSRQQRQAAVARAPTQTADSSDNSAFITVARDPTQTADSVDNSSRITVARDPTQTSDSVDNSSRITVARDPIQTADSVDNSATSNSIEDLESESHELDRQDSEGGSPKEDRDEEMEDMLAMGLTGDAYADYDLDISKEGEAIAEYLALLESATGVKTGSS